MIWFPSVGRFDADLGPLLSGSALTGVLAGPSALVELEHVRWCDSEARTECRSNELSVSIGGLEFFDSILSTAEPSQQSACLDIDCQHELLAELHVVRF